MLLSNYYINLSNFFFRIWKVNPETESDRRESSLWGVPCDNLLNKLIKTSILFINF